MYKYKLEILSQLSGVSLLSYLRRPPAFRALHPRTIASSTRGKFQIMALAERSFILGVAAAAQRSNGSYFRIHLSKVKEEPPTSRNP